MPEGPDDKGGNEEEAKANCGTEPKNDPWQAIA